MLDGLLAGRVVPVAPALGALRDDPCVHLRRPDSLCWGHKLRASLEDWLLPHLYGKKSAGDLQQLNLPPILREPRTYDQLDDWAPTHVTVLIESDRPIDYSDSEATPTCITKRQVEP